MTDGHVQLIIEEESTSMQLVNQNMDDDAADTPTLSYGDNNTFPVLLYRQTKTIQPLLGTKYLQTSTK